MGLICRIVPTDGVGLIGRDRPDRRIGLVLGDERRGVAILYWGAAERRCPYLGANQVASHAVAKELVDVVYGIHFLCVSINSSMCRPALFDSFQHVACGKNRVSSLSDHEDGSAGSLLDPDRAVFHAIRGGVVTTLDGNDRADRLLVEIQSIHRQCSESLGPVLDRNASAATTLVVAISACSTIRMDAPVADKTADVNPDAAPGAATGHPLHA